MNVQFTVADLRAEIDRRAEEQQATLRREFVARCIADGVDTDERLRQFVWAAFGVQIPNKQICEKHQTPFRAFADAFFARAPVSVWKASRGLGGKSYLLALLGLCEAVLLHADVNILGGSGKQSQNVLAHMGDFWFSPFAPRDRLVTDVSREMRLAGGNTVEALLASQTSVRGPHPSRLRLDECLAEGTMVSTERGDLPIENVLPGDRVWQFDGARFVLGSVLAVANKGIRDTLLLQFGSRELCCTPEHKLFSERGGWKYAKDFVRSEGVYSMWKDADTEQNRQNARRKRIVPQLLEQAKAHRNAGASELLSLRKQEGFWQQRMPGLRVRDARKAIVFLLRLWDPVFARVSAVQKMFAEIRVVNEWKFAADRSARQFSETVQQSPGARYDGSARGPRFAVRAPETSRQVHSGFYSDGLFDCTGNAGRLLAFTRRFGSQESTRRFHIFTRLYGRLFSAIQETFVVSPDTGNPGIARLAGIKGGGNRRVFDLTTEYHNFVANGLLVHNCDEMSLPILDAAMGQPMSKNGVVSQVVQSSTHQYADGTMTQCILRAAEMGYPVYEWCYKETQQPHGWADLVDIERKRSQMTAATWLNEVELQEPSPESRAIVLGAVQATFRPELGVFDGLPRQYIQIEAPVQGARYATGADWAKDVDWTVIVTFRTDVDPMRLVAFERTGREPYPVMIGKLDERVKNYPGNRAHDATGLGNVVSDYIEQGADNIKMVGRRRADLFSEYIAGIERGEIIAPMIKFMETQHRLCSVDDLYGAGHPPDSLVAGAMAYKAAGRRRDADLGKAQNKPVNSRWITQSSVQRETTSGGGRWRNVGSR